MVSGKVPLTSSLKHHCHCKFHRTGAACLQEVVPTGKSQLGLVDLHNVQVGVPIVRTNPEVDQDARVVSFPHKSDDHLKAGRGSPLSVGKSDWPTTELGDCRLQGSVVEADDCGHVDAALVEVLRLVADVRVLCTSWLFQEAFQDDLQLVAEHVEGRHTAAVLGDDMLTVPVSAGKLEEVITGVGGPVHCAKKRGSCLDTLWGEADWGARPAGS